MASTGTCPVPGKSDMYGLGIRIAFYTQWYTLLLAEWIAPSEVPFLRLALTTFIAAEFLALIIQTSKNALQPVEVFMILLLVFGFYLWFVPLNVWRAITCWNPRLDPSRYPLVRPGNLYGLLSFLLLISVAAFEVWFWLGMVPGLDGRTCKAYGFLFAQVQLNDGGYRVVNAIFFLAIFLVCVGILVIKFSLYVGCVVRTDDDGETPRLRYHCFRSWYLYILDHSMLMLLVSRDQRNVLRTWHSVANVIVSSVIIAAVESTIQSNGISGVNELDSAAQLIPFLIGIGFLARTVYIAVGGVYDIDDTISDTTTQAG